MCLVTTLQRLEWWVDDMNFPKLKKNRVCFSSLLMFYTYLLGLVWDCLSGWLGRRREDEWGGIRGPKLHLEPGSGIDGPCYGAPRYAALWTRNNTVLLTPILTTGNYCSRLWPCQYFLGVCEPMDDERCKGKNDWVVCNKQTELECDVLGDSGRFNIIR